MANITEDVTLTRSAIAPTNFQFNLGARGFQPPANIVDSGGTTQTGEAGDLIITANNVNFTAEDCVIYITGTGQSGLRTLNNDTVTGSSFNLRNCIIDMNDSEGFQQVRCGVNATDVTFYQDGNAVNWGNFTGAATIFNLNNVRFWGYTFFPNFSNLAAGSTLNNLSFYNGDALDPLGAYLESGQLQAYVNPTFGPVTRPRSAFASGGANPIGVAFMRVNNESNRGGGNDDGWSPYAQIDLRALPLVGDAGNDNANRICISVDRDVGLWLINPLLPDFTGVTNSIQWIGTAGDGGRRPATASPATISSYHAWNPRFVDSVTTAVIPDTQVRFDNNFLPVPDTYAYGSAPTEVTAPAVRTTAQVAADNGYLFREQTATFSAVTSNAFIDPVTGGGVQMDLNFTDRTGQIYSLTHGVGDEIGMRYTLVYPGVGQPLDQDGTTVNTFQSFDATGITWADFTNYPLTEDIYYGFGTSQNTVNNIDNIYPSIKTTYYNAAPTFVGIGTVGLENNSIRFDRTTGLQSGTSHNVTENLVRVNCSQNPTLGDNITTLITNDVGSSITNVNVPSGLTLESVGNSGIWNFTNVNVAGGSTFNGRFSGVNGSSVASGQTFVGGTRILFELNEPDFAITDATFTGTGNIELNRATAGTGTLTITVPQALNADDGAAQGFTAGNGVTLMNTPVGVTTTTINIDTTVAGNYAIDINGTLVRSATAFTAGEIITPMTLDSSTYSAGTPFRVFIKYDSDITTRTVYQEMVESFTFNDQMDVTINITQPQPVANTLVEGMVTSLPGVAITATTDLGQGTPATIVELTNTDAPSTAITLDPTRGITLAALIANEDDYFRAWALTARSGNTDPIVEYRQAEVVRFNISNITFQSGNTISDGTNTFRVQHVIRNWQGGGGDTTGPNRNAFAFSRTGAPEVLPQVEGTALLSTVISAVDQSMTAARVQNVETRAERIHNGVGYLVGSGNDSRLVGIKPRSSAYVAGSTTDEGNL